MTTITKSQIASVIRQIQTQPRWKPGRDLRHLHTRKLRGHLPNEATLQDYHIKIHEVVTTDEASVYLFWY